MNEEVVVMEPKKYQFLSGGALKIIAIIIMLIDHIGASVIARLLNGGYFSDLDYTRFKNYYEILRTIGRIAFPIFCFLLVEGFLHTRSPKKYIVRLGVFGLISEWPFDMAFFQQWTYKHQNVFFTLFIGLICIWGMDSLSKNKFFSDKKIRFKDFLLVMIQVIIAFAGMACALYLNTDYNMYGVLVIIVLYIFRKERGFSALAGYFVMFKIDTMCFPGFLLTQFYNGKRGIKLKYLFYLFYPAHLLILWYIGTVLLASK
ncbi:MAG TPA: TraX family protein [Lachnospiraceae bacterium]|nr:TraX family protein [Lachnospiraceae bacterium]